MGDPRPVSGCLAGGAYFVDVGLAHDLELHAAVLQLGDRVDVGHDAAFTFSRNVLDVFVEAVAIAELVVLVHGARGERNDLAGAPGKVNHPAVADDQLDVRQAIFRLAVAERQ